MKLPASESFTTLSGPDSLPASALPEDMEPQDREQLRAVVAALAPLCYLIGSRVKGTHRLDSDVDLLRREGVSLDDVFEAVFNGVDDINPPLVRCSDHSEGASLLVHLRVRVDVSAVWTAHLIHPVRIFGIQMFGAITGDERTKMRAALALHNAAKASGIIPDDTPRPDPHQLLKSISF